MSHYPILIVGGGTAGITVAAQLRQRGVDGIAILEPSTKHYYQPLWTLVGAGVVAKEETARDEADYIPEGVTWIQDAVAAFEPAANAVVTRAGTRLTYDQLVVAVGIQLDWHKIEGLGPEHLGKDGIVSNYRYDLVDSTWRELQAFRGGTALFTFPATPIKCAGAPQKIMYLAEDHLRRAGVRERSRIVFASAGAKIFGVERYARTLRQVIERKGIETLFRHDLVAIRPAKKEAVFRHLDQGTDVVVPYDLIHIVPPQSAPDVIKTSPLADAGGWVEVDKYTLQSPTFANVFSLGDGSSLPTSRTGAAVRKEAPVLVDNLIAFRAGAPLAARYDGYASCPLITGYGKLVLAEFDYDGKPAESFPFDQSKERYSMYALKAYGLPEMYWNGMLRGRM